MSIIMLAFPNGAPITRSSPKISNSRAAMTIPKMHRALGMEAIPGEVAPRTDWMYLANLTNPLELATTEESGSLLKKGIPTGRSVDACTHAS
jgi:hypothetical protein